MRATSSASSNTRLTRITVPSSRKPSLDDIPAIEPHAVEDVPRPEVELRPDPHLVDRPADGRALLLIDAAADGRDIAAHARLRPQPDAPAYRHDVVVHAAKHGDAAANGDDRIGHQLVFADDDAAADVDLCRALAPVDVRRRLVSRLLSRRRPIGGGFIGRRWRRWRRRRRRIPRGQHRGRQVRDLQHEVGVGAESLAQLRARRGRAVDGNEAVANLDRLQPAHLAPRRQHEAIAHLQHAKSTSRRAT